MNTSPNVRSLLKTKGNVAMWTIAVLSLVFLVGVVIFAPDGSEVVVDTEPVAQEQQVEWVTYTNEEFGFSIDHPSDWTVAAFAATSSGDVYVAEPIFNIYKPGSDTSKLPYTHHAGNISHVSIFPRGMPMDGFSGTMRDSTINFTPETTGKFDFVLKNGDAFATKIDATSTPSNWNEFAYFFANAAVNDLKESCEREGAAVPEGQCDIYSGDTILHEGTVNAEDRAIEVRILESFRFI